MIMENESNYTTLELGDKKYSLIYDFDAVMKAEDLTGMALLVGVDWSNVGVSRIRAMLYASLLTAQPDITLDEVTKLITFSNVLKIEQALVKAWRGPADVAAEEPKEEPATVEAEPEAAAA
jgi:hypothetical protein